MSDAVSQVKAERKRREGLERELRSANEARAEAQAAAAKASEQLKCVICSSLAVIHLHSLLAPSGVDHALACGAASALCCRSSSLSLLWWLCRTQASDLERWRTLAEERAALVKQAENAAIEMRQRCDKQVHCWATEL